MTGKFDVVGFLPCVQVDDRERAVTVPNKHRLFSFGFQTDVIGVVQVRNRCYELVILPGKNFEETVSTARDAYLFFIRQINDTLGLSRPSDGRDALFVEYADDFYGVVAERGDEKSLLFQVNREVIET